MMKNLHLIDLHFLETEEAIASFLVKTTAGPILIETGPESTFSQLKKSLHKLGYQIEDIKHVFLTHIHFDHAGAAWKFAKAGAMIYVHPLGLPHLASPEKLWNSASQIYGNQMERLWGSMSPIAEKNLIGVEANQIFKIGEVEIQALHTPGHAVHHIAWKIAESIFTGDVAGVMIQDGPVVPPCPPPDIHLEDWRKSIALLKSMDPKSLYLTHFGLVIEPQKHLSALENILDDWATWMKPYFEAAVDQQSIIPKFMEYTKSQLISQNVDEAIIQVYEYANPSWMSVAGLMRYWKLKSKGLI